MQCSDCRPPLLNNTTNNTISTPLYKHSYCKMGTRKWLEPHNNYCFSKFTNSAEDDGKWCIVGADSDSNPVLVMPNTTRGVGPDLIKKWFAKARVGHADLFSTINFQCFQSNVKTAASKWYNRAHNPENGSNPPRTMTDQHATTTQDQEDNQNSDDDPPAITGDVLQAADEDNISLVCDTIFLHNGKGNKMPFNYIQAKYMTSFRTSAGAYRSKETCHITIHMPSALKLTNQNPTFYTISGNGLQLVLTFKPPPAVFTKKYWEICLPALEQTNPTNIWQRERCILLFQQS